MNVLKNKMLLGVPDSLNLIIRESISSVYPLEVPFYVDDTAKSIDANLHYKCKSLESAAENIKLTICIKGEDKITVNETCGSIDLSQWITPGWSEITLKSNTPIKIKGQLNVRSFIQF